MSDSIKFRPTYRGAELSKGRAKVSIAIHGDQLFEVKFSGSVDPRDWGHLGMRLESMGRRVTEEWVMPMDAIEDDRLYNGGNYTGDLHARSWVERGAVNLEITDDPHNGSCLVKFKAANGITMRVTGGGMMGGKECTLVGHILCELMKGAVFAPFGLLTKEALARTVRDIVERCKPWKSLDDDDDDEERSRA
ncbi:MAG: hypothetical protein KKH12_15890 [Gammaproteobacteria bacterium]|nr:hypothetical protein [Gammaproteobacteria bacterium]